MSNEFRGQEAHSAEYFGDTRDHWWNDDQLFQAARCWGAEAFRDVLDVGCGVGHWTRALARVLPAGARFTGVDREARWVEKARERAAGAGMAGRVDVRQGDAATLPFEDGSFDLVTCQTVLMHLPDPGAALVEMVRVTRPGGVVAVAEPTNVLGAILDSIALGDPPATTAGLLGFQLVCDAGKRALGEGDNLIGETIPARLYAAGLRDVALRLNDRAALLNPPYTGPFQAAMVEDALDDEARRMGIWDEATTRRYHRAGGGTEAGFEEGWARALALVGRRAQAIRERRYSSPGGHLHYLCWGWKGRDAAATPGEEPAGPPSAVSSR